MVKNWKLKLTYILHINYEVSLRMNGSQFSIIHVIMGCLQFFVKILLFVLAIQSQ